MSTVDDASDSIEFRDIVIVGGGCYGSFYAGQLERARARDRVTYRQLLIVDRDADCQLARESNNDDTRRLVVQEWGDFFDDYLTTVEVSEGGGPPDAIVPSPLMPHLMYEWLVRRARCRWPRRMIETRHVTTAPGTPYDVSAPDGTRYISFADWICPTHCIEPALCPVIRAPRTWEMADTMENLTRKLNEVHPTAGPVLLVCEHRVFGVGMFDVSAVLSGDRTVAAAGQRGSPIDVLVGTISSCHGAVNLLHLGVGS
ncbi:MAG TPA: hypothetical protein VJ808_09330 [Gemmatimonadales bacterium]|nr:hypothetical protein [Gemmatimonadales bacterium]